MAELHDYLREYPCLDYHSLSNALPKNCLNITFYGPVSTEKRSLPTAIIDSYRQKPCLYTLMWRHKPRLSLIISSLEEPNPIEITMNILPQRAAVVNGFLYLLTQHEIAVVRMSQTPSITLFPLENDPIVAVYGSLRRMGQSEQLHTGLNVVYFSPRKHHYSHFYNHSHREAPNPLEELTRIVGRSASSFQHFSVVIPNVLGLVVLNDREFCLMDLGRMELCLPTVRQLTVGRFKGEPVVRWRAQQGGFLLGIGVGEVVQLWNVQLKLLQNLGGVQQLLDTSLVDWTSIQLNYSMSFLIQGDILIDLLLVRSGLVYYCKQCLQDQLGTMRYIYYSNPHQHNPILNHQATLWKEHLNDKIQSNLTVINRLFVPNRYPQRLINQYSFGDLPTKGTEILNQWRSQYSFQGLMVWQGQVLILRANSISLIRAVHPMLSPYLDFDQQRRIIAEKRYVSQAEGYVPLQLLSSKNDSFYQQNQLVYEHDRPQLQPIRHQPLQRDDDILIEMGQQRHAERVLFQISEICSKEKLQWRQCNLVSSAFRSQLILSQLYDQISCYSLLLNSWQLRAGQGEDRQLWEGLKLKAKILEHFYLITQQASDQILSFNDNLLSYFVKQQKDMMTSDTATSIKALTRKLLVGLTPDWCPEEDKNPVNPFIEWLISLLIDLKGNYVIGNEPQAHPSWCNRFELKEILELGVLQACKWQNTSLIKALLLCNEPQIISVNLPMCLKSSPDIVLKHYSNFQQYVTVTCGATIENILLAHGHTQSLDPELIAIEVEEVEISQRLENAVARLKDNSRWSQAPLSSLVEQQLLDLIRQLEKEQSYQVVTRIKQFVNSLETNTDQQLQCLENALAGMIRILNTHAVKEPTKNSSILLSWLLSLLEKIYEQYKLKFSILYGAQRTSNIHHMETTQFNFIQDSRFAILGGLPCCTYTLGLLREAIQQEGPITLLSDRLNLVTFGLNIALQDGNAEKQSTCLTVLTQWADKEVKECLDICEDFMEMARRGCRIEIENEGNCAWEHLLTSQ